MNESIDMIQEFQRAMSLKIEAAKDNISVYFRRINGVMEYRVIKTPCKSYDLALQHVRYHQSRLAPSTEARS